MSMRIRWRGRLARKVVKRTARMILVERAVGKRRFALPQRRWECNIKVGLKQIGWLGANLIRVAQDKDQWWAIVSKKMRLRVPQLAGKFLTIGGNVSF
jgi:hypothetical protein